MEKILTQEKCNSMISQDLMEGWRNLDSELIIKHLDKTFKYDSFWTYETLDYNGYTSYIRQKFERLHQSGQKIETSLHYCPGASKGVVKLIQNGNVLFYHFEIKNGYIIKGDLCPF